MFNVCTSIAPQQGVSPLLVACRMGVRYLDSIQLLLAHGAEPNGPDNSVSEERSMHLYMNMYVHVYLHRNGTLILFRPLL